MGANATALHYPALRAEDGRARRPLAACYAESHFEGHDVIKILLLIALGFVVLALIRAYQRSLNKPPETPREPAVEDMVKCAHCGVNLPRSEAIYSGGAFFCTPEHQARGRK
jgi:uncharacterized protein